MMSQKSMTGLVVGLAEPRNGQRLTVIFVVGLSFLVAMHAWLTDQLSRLKRGLRQFPSVEDFWRQFSVIAINLCLSITRMLSAPLPLLFGGEAVTSLVLAPATSTVTAASADTARMDAKGCYWLGDLTCPADAGGRLVLHREPTFPVSCPQRLRSRGGFLSAEDSISFSHSRKDIK